LSFPETGSRPTPASADHDTDQPDSAEGHEAVVAIDLQEDVPGARPVILEPARPSHAVALIFDGQRLRADCSYSTIRALLA